ncbi:MAG: hypothetical protein PHF63_14305 [Herbinix sp.]|nr:hypothetical protein [Herbinix sp.]
MKNNTKNNKKNTKNPKYQRISIFDTKGKKIAVSITSAVILLLIILFMFIESGDGKLVIKNKSDLNLEYVKAKFVYSDGDVNTGIETESINADKTFTLPMDPIDLYGYNANYELRLKFENYDELLVDAGIFNDVFEGDIEVDFEKTEDPNIIKLKIKASNGLLPSKLIDCNEEYKINLSDGQVLE